MREFLLKATRRERETLIIDILTQMPKPCFTCKSLLNIITRRSIFARWLRTKRRKRKCFDVFVNLARLKPNNLASVCLISVKNYWGLSWHHPKRCLQNCYVLCRQTLKLFPQILSNKWVKSWGRKWKPKGETRLKSIECRLFVVDAKSIKIGNLIEEQ